MYSTRQKIVAYTVYRFSVFSSVFRVVPFYRFTVPFTVLPFRSPFCRSVLPFYRSKYRLSRERGAPRAVIAGEYLEVLKLGRCSATINGRHVCGAVRGTAHPCERTFRGNACCLVCRCAAATGVYPRARPRVSV